MLGVMAVLMLAPPRILVRTFRVPRRVLWRTYVHRPDGRPGQRSPSPARCLCLELGLVGPVSRQLWKALGVWER
jgi:hypothetical protein